MIDHITIGVSDYLHSRDFYTAILAPLGYPLLREVITPESQRSAGYGPADFKPGFWLTDSQPVSSQVHFCFQSETRAGVRAFYEAAMNAGAVSDFAPGIVEEYHPSYYAAFVLDPDGYKIEVLCLENESPA